MILRAKLLNFTRKVKLKSERGVVGTVVVSRLLVVDLSGVRYQFVSRRRRLVAFLPSDQRDPSSPRALQTLIP